jgi:hypothetical protein
MQKPFRPGKVRPLPHHIALLAAFLILVQPVAGWPGSQPVETAVAEIKAHLATIEGMDQTTLRQLDPRLQAFSYGELRALQAISRLAGITREEILLVATRLGETPIDFDTVLLLEYFTGLPQASPAQALNLLDQLRDCDFVTARSLASLVRLKPPDGPALLPLIAMVRSFDQPGQWAAKAIFEVQDLAFADVAQAITLLTSLQARQLWAVEQLCRLAGWRGPELLRAIEAISRVTPAEARNGQALFADPSLTPSAALSWITGFLVLPGNERESRFKLLTVPEKNTLLAAYRRSAEEFIMEINNLHDITDPFGGEIGEDRLRGTHSATVEDLFARLHPAAQAPWSAAMARAIAADQGAKAITILRQATALARQATADDLTTANLYMLMAEGSELYTSSFRDILVPTLANRLRDLYQGDILAFLVAADPPRRAVSPFITNLVEKGSLARFLPQDSAGQKKMADLVAESAFEDQYRLLLFSSALPKLLQALSPEARSHLIELMLAATSRNEAVLARQLQVILQYILDKYGSRLLSSADRGKIVGLGKPPINVSHLTRTPFRQWREDNSLKSLSVFQQDRDGQSSFLANCQALLAHGYRPSLSTTFSLGTISPESQAELHEILESLAPPRHDGLTRLFRFSTKSPIILDWRKSLNNVEIAHAVAVYQGKSRQQQLLVQFLQNGCEMFAQRGHSYWRHDQLSGPLLELVTAGRVNSRELRGKQRFLSLGSCGGIKAYLELNRIFHDRVDILATVGTGRLTVNNLYNRTLFELVATRPDLLSWEEVAGATAPIFAANAGEEYLQPGSLPAILFKMAYHTATSHDPD